MIIFRQYFVIGIKDGPLEIWDLKSMSMLSKMSKRFPAAVCMVRIDIVLNSIYYIHFIQLWPNYGLTLIYILLFTIYFTLSIKKIIIQSYLMLSNK